MRAASSIFGPRPVNTGETIDSIRCLPYALLSGLRQVKSASRRPTVLRNPKLRAARVRCGKWNLEVCWTFFTSWIPLDQSLPKCSGRPWARRRRHSPSLSPPLHFLLGVVAMLGCATERGRPCLRTLESGNRRAAGVGCLTGSAPSAEAAVRWTMRHARDSSPACSRAR